MPRKTKGLAFEVHPGPKKNENGETLLYATTESGRKISLGWCHGENPKLQRTRINHNDIYTET